LKISIFFDFDKQGLKGLYRQPHLLDEGIKKGWLLLEVVSLEPLCTPSRALNRVRSRMGRQPVSVDWQEWGGGRKKKKKTEID